MRRRRISKLRSAVLSTPWAILPQKLEAIVELVDQQSAGLGVNRDAAKAMRGQHPQLADYTPAGGAANSPDAPKIAVLNLYGTIAQRMNIMMEYSGGTSTEMFGKAFDAAIADSNISAIVIRIDSPGGAVPGVQELSDKIFNARGTKPIVAFIDPMMCSAATWIGTAAERLVATPSALQIGSIGVIYTHFEQSQRDQQEGDTYTVLRSVPGKAEGNPHEPLTDTYRTHLDELISGIHEKFVATVARNRKVAVTKVESAFGAGRTLTADEALTVGLIDKIQTFEALLAELGASVRPSSPSGARASVPSPRSSSMHPKIKMALIQAGLAKATATAEEFQAALVLLFETRGIPVPATEEAIIAALQPAAAQVTQLQPATLSVGEAVKPSMSASEVLGLVATAGHALSAEEKIELSKDLVAQAADGKLSVSQVLDRINERSTAATQPAGASRVQVAADAQDKFVAAARDAIISRSHKGEQPKQIYNAETDSYIDWKPQARNHGLSTLLGIATQCLMTAGVPAQKVLSLSPYHLAKLMMGADPSHIGLGRNFLAASDGPSYNVSGMFSNILYDAANVSLRRSYDVARTTYQTWAAQGEDIADFKPVHRILAGEFGDPKAIPEDGTFEETTLTDGRESYKLTVWGEIFSLSWDLIIGDNLGAFMDAPNKMGNAMKRKLNRLVYQVIKDNANLADGGALFNGTAITSAGGHNNLTTGSLSGYAAYGAAWSAMNTKMRNQRGLSADSSTLNIPPAFILLPPALHDVVYTVLGSASVVVATAGSSATKNIWEGALQPVEESELSAAASGGSDTAFYLAASPADVDTVEYAHLMGMPAPVIEQQVAFDRLAVRRRIYFAFGTKALDFRGLQKHSGA